MRRLKASSEDSRAIEASKLTEDEGHLESNDLRGRAARSAGVLPTAELNSGGSPGAREIPRRSKVLETTTTTPTMTDESDMGADSIAPSAAEGGVMRRRAKKVSQTVVAMSTQLHGSREKSMKHARMLRTDGV